MHGLEIQPAAMPEISGASPVKAHLGALQYSYVIGILSSQQGKSILGSYNA